MDDDYFHIRFFHKGKFENGTYVGGEEAVFKNVERDRWSYTELMEYVKDDLGYSEIGGIYTKKEGWKLCANGAQLSEYDKDAKTGDHLDFYIDNVVDDKIQPLKQMQPHVVMRPRPNLFAAKNPPRRMFVSSHQLQQQKNRKAADVVNSPRKSARINNLSDVINSPRRSTRLNQLQGNSPKKSTRMNNQEVNSRRKSRVQKVDVVSDANLKVSSAKRKLDLQSPPNEDENMGENELEDLPPPPPPPPLSEYEKQRAVNITINDQVYKKLGLPTLAKDLRAEMKEKKRGKDLVQEEGSEYDPGAEDTADDDGENNGENKRKRSKKESKGKLTSGPTTRSRSAAPQKDASAPTPRASVLVEPAKQIQLPQIEGVGTMANYLAMRKRQQTKNARENATIASGSGIQNDRVDAEDVLPDIGEEESEEVEVPKRTRGKTIMNKVHTRPFEKRIIIDMNADCQPISDDDKVVSEFGQFLGTLKKCVPLTYKSWKDVPENLKTTLLNYVKQRYIFPDELEGWVLKSINVDWKGYKSRTKTKHFSAYATDEERLENRPDDIPLEEFKVLLQYWGDQDIQAKAEKNAESRHKYVDTHTAGTKLFSQIRHKMAKESDTGVFVKTRKRKPGRKYKTDGRVTKFIIDKIENVLGSDLSGPTDGVDELLLNPKQHGPSWLIGRCVKPPKGSSSGPSNSQISELTTKIRQEVAEEMEEKMKKQQEEVDAKMNKMQENFTWVLKKLGEANPTINANLAELCATISSDHDGTPVTGGGATN